VLASVIPGDVLAGIVGATVAALLHLARQIARLSERLARLEERARLLDDERPRRP
jgi:cob(I)alamin adenosyltransferase